MIKNENYIQLSGWMVNELHLEGNELLIYALIYGFSQDGFSEFSGSIKYIQEWFGIKSEKTVRTCLKSLENKGFITKKRVLGSTSKFKATPVKITGLSGKNYRTTPVKITDNNNSNIKLYKKGKKSTEQYQSFPQNQYDFEELEKELLSN